MSRRQSANSTPSREHRSPSISLRGRNVRIALWFSVILSVSVAALWARSYYESDVLNQISSSWGCDLRSGIGEVILTFDRGQHLHPRSLFWLHDTYTEQRRNAWHHGEGVAGFNLATIVQGTTTYRQIKVPHWFLAAILALPAALLFLLARRESAISVANACIVCGYDLRSTPVRCPECGAVVVRTRAPPSTGVT
jgi:predicted RNA-binding Zn-ribbon protein involved in translation (DUF1610 family)